MDLIAVVSLEQVEDVGDEVVDLNDGIVAEPGQRDGGGGVIVIVVVVGHGDALQCDQRREAARRGVDTSG